MSFGAGALSIPSMLKLAPVLVLAVVSQPDRPAGRGLEVTPTPVKAAAAELGLRVVQPVNTPRRLAAGS